MDTGVNRNGVCWVIDDERAFGKGYVARLRRDGQPLVFAGREGFSTHEDAVEWASRFESDGDDDARSYVPILVAGLGVVVLLSFVVSIARVISGAEGVRVNVRFGRGRELEPRRLRGGVSARPITSR